MGNFLWKALEAYTAHDGRVLSDVPIDTGMAGSPEGFRLCDLANVAQGYATVYKDYGIERQDPVGVYFKHGLQSLLHFFALTRIGAIPALVNDRMPGPEAANFLKQVGVVALA